MADIGGGGFGGGAEAGGAPTAGDRESRKRPYERDGGNFESPHKRSNEGSGGGSQRGGSEDTTCQFKMMVSNKDAGTIIGRGGATIASLQNKSGTRIRVSNANDYFPGTQERVVLLAGATSQVVSGCTAILHELFRDSESFRQAAQTGEADKTTLNHKLLVPEISCGQVIGKGGENINKMEAESGCKIQLTPKEKQANCGERIVSVIGNLEQVVAATRMIIVKIWDDPKCRYDNLSTVYNSAPAYGGRGGGGYDEGRNFDDNRGGSSWRGRDESWGLSSRGGDSRGGGGYGGGGYRGGGGPFDSYGTRGDAYGGRGGGSGGGGDLYASVYPKSSSSDPYANAYPSRGRGDANERGGGRGGGGAVPFDPYANVYGAGGGGSMHVGAPPSSAGGHSGEGGWAGGNYAGGVGGGPGGGGMGRPSGGGWGAPTGGADGWSGGGPPPAVQSAMGGGGGGGGAWGGPGGPAPGYGYGGAAVGGGGGGGGWGGGRDGGGTGWGAGPPGGHASIRDGYAAGGPRGGGGGGSGGGNVQYTLHVSDSVIPGILGRGGQVIKEIQETSGASIKVSQKGDYVPGTSLRIITISGNQEAASYAHQLISAKIPTQ